jgi:Icc-related predicted phosphoesterase
MKGLHLSDVHNDYVSLARLRNWAKERSDLEFMAFTGDILHPILDFEEAAKENYAFGMISDFINNNIKIKEGQEPDLAAILGAVYSHEKTPKEIKEAIEYHISVTNEFDKNAIEQYMNMVEIFKQFPQKVFTIPGNCDSPVYFQIFRDFDIHGEAREINGIKFAGFGGDSRVGGLMPALRAIPFSEKLLHDFLVKEDPDIAMTHSPPFGIHDEVSDEDNWGKWATLAYMRAQAPSLLLCGHVHERRGIGKEDYQGTLVVNSGNLGHYRQTKSFGTFYEIDIDTKTKAVNYIIPYRVFAGEIMRDEDGDYVESGILYKKAYETEKEPAEKKIDEEKQEMETGKRSLLLSQE